MNKWILFSGAITLLLAGVPLGLDEYTVGGLILACMGASLVKCFTNDDEV